MSGNSCGTRQIDAYTAFKHLMGVAFTTNRSSANLGGPVPTTGVSWISSPVQLTDNLQLDILGNPNAIFLFQAGSTLTTAVGSSLPVIHGNAGGGGSMGYGNAATVGTRSLFLGNVLANQIVTMIATANSGDTRSENGSLVFSDISTITTCPNRQPCCCSAPLGSCWRAS